MTYIYILERNDIPFYVGKAKNTVRRKHKHYDTYGIDIKMSIIDNCDDGIECWKPLESFWIMYMKFLGFDLKNKNGGGGGPSSYSEESKIKMRKPRCEGTGAKISKTLIERNHSKYYTEEVKSKMGINMKGTHGGPFTEIHISQLKEGSRKNSKRLFQYDLNGNFIKEWKSKGEAFDYIKTYDQRALSQNVISQIKDCCLGRMISCWGYIWRYKDEFIPVVPKYYPIEQYKGYVLINTFYNELEAELYCQENFIIRNKKTKIRDLIKISIKQNKRFYGFNWKYKYE
jgi:hypothetical protein